MIEVQGADQLARLSKALKDASDKELQKELSKAISAATKPFIVNVRRSAGRLPTRGGLAARVAKTPMRTVKTRSGVRVVAKSSYGIGLLDRGIAWHPVYGNRDVWVKQPVQSGFWSEPEKEAAPVAQKEILKAMDRVASKIDRSV